MRSGRGSRVEGGYGRGGRRRDARGARSVAGNGSWATRLGESVGDGGGRARGVRRVVRRDVPSRRTCRRRVVATTDGKRRGRRGITHNARGFMNRRRENARGGETRADREGDGAKARWRVARREKRTPALRSCWCKEQQAASRRVVHLTAIESQKKCALDRQNQTVVLDLMGVES